MIILKFSIIFYFLVNYPKTQLSRFKDELSLPFLIELKQLNEWSRGQT